MKLQTNADQLDKLIREQGPSSIKWSQRTDKGTKNKENAFQQMNSRTIESMKIKDS